MVSDFFADKKYQEMDWISKAVSPWEFNLLPILASIPETIEITPAMICSSIEEYSDISVAKLVSNEAKKLGFEIDNCLSMASTWLQIFKIDLPDNTKFNFSTMSINNQIFMRKTKPTLDEADCLNYASELIRSIVGWNFKIPQDAVARAGEILDLLNVDPSKHRGARARERALKTAIYAVINEDKWRIRNMELVSKLGDWIVEYIGCGRLASMANFAKLKVMTHTGQPIYSMQEVEDEN